MANAIGDSSFTTSLHDGFYDTVNPETPSTRAKTRDRIDREREEREIRLLREREAARQVR